MTDTSVTPSRRSTPVGTCPTCRRQVLRLLATLAVMIGSELHATVLLQNFDAVAARPSVPSGPGGSCPQDPAFLAAGWRVINTSELAGSATPSTRCVTQGFPDIPFYYDPSYTFYSQDGSAYGSAGFPSRAAPDPAYASSLWMISPRVEFGTGAALEFWTQRAHDGGSGADRLQVRVMAAGGDPDVGTTPTSVGQFTTLLLDINPTGTAAMGGCGAVITDPPNRVIANYPSFDWCRIRLTALSGLPESGSGYIAFRYYAPRLTNPPYPDAVGIDTFSFDSGTIATVAPTLSYGVPPGSTITASGAILQGETARIDIPVAIGAPGSGSGPQTQTTLACTPPDAPFSGFAPAIVAQPGFNLSASALSGSCVLGAQALQTLTCTETRGAAPPISIQFLLRCPSGVSLQDYNRYADAVRADDPLLYWRLGESQGAARNSATGPSSVGALGDGSVSAGVLRAQGAVPTVGVVADGAAGFVESSTDRISSPLFEKQPPGSTGLSFETWLKFTGAVSDYVNLVGDRPFDLTESVAFLYLTPGRQIRMHIHTNADIYAIDSAGPALVAGQTYHVVGTWDASSGLMRIYINGAEAPVVVSSVGNPTDGRLTFTAHNPIQVGSDAFQTGVGADVVLDETAVYAHELPVQRIRIHYDLGSMFYNGFED